MLSSLNSMFWGIPGSLDFLRETPRLLLSALPRPGVAVQQQLPPLLRIPHPAATPASPLVLGHSSSPLLKAFAHALFCAVASPAPHPSSACDEVNSFFKYSLHVTHGRLLWPLNLLSILPPIDFLPRHLFVSWTALQIQNKSFLPHFRVIFLKTRTCFGSSI